MPDDIEKISQNIRQAICCPVCYCLMTNFGYVCDNGHIICSSCSYSLDHVKRVNSCPTCRSRLTTESPMMQRLKSMYAVLSIACINRANGCPAVHKISAITLHEKQCLYTKKCLKATITS